MSGNEPTHMGSVPKSYLPRYRQAIHRVGDRVCQEIKLPQGRWAPGSRFETPMAYKSPPVDVVADRLASRKGFMWSNPCVGLGTVIKASDNRRHLLVKMDETGEMREHNARELIHSNLGRMLSNQQVLGMIETVQKQDRTRIRLLADQAALNDLPKSDAEILRATTQYGNTLPLPSMVSEARRLRPTDAQIREAMVERERALLEAAKAAEGGATGGAPYAYTSTAPAKPSPAASFSSSSSAPAAAAGKGETTVILLRGADGVDRQIEVPFKVADAAVVQSLDASSGDVDGDIASNGDANGAEGGEYQANGDVASAGEYLPPGTIAFDGDASTAVYVDAAGNPVAVSAPQVAGPAAAAAAAAARSRAKAQQSAVVRRDRAEPRSAPTPVQVAAAKYAAEHHRGATPVPAANLPGGARAATPLARGTPVTARAGAAGPAAGGVPVSLPRAATQAQRKQAGPAASASSAAAPASGSASGKGFSLAQFSAQDSAATSSGMLDIHRTRTPVVSSSSSAATARTRMPSAAYAAAAVAAPSPVSAAPAPYATASVSRYAPSSAALNDPSAAYAQGVKPLIAGRARGDAGFNPQAMVSAPVDVPQQH